MDLRTFLSYDPESDRLIGGDQFRLLQGKLTKQTLMPLQHAERLYPSMQRLAEQRAPGAGPVSGDLPTVLGVLKLEQFPAWLDGEEQQVPIAMLFRAEPLTLAPPHYLSLALMVCVVPDDRTTFETAGMPLDASLVFGRRVFQILGSAHRSAITLSRGEGTCLQREFVTPDGKFTDLYFLTTFSAEGEDAPAFEQNRRADLANGLSLLSGIGPKEPSALAECMVLASECYLGYPVSRRVRDLIANSARTSGERPPSFFELADQLAGRPPT